MNDLDDLAAEAIRQYLRKKASEIDAEARHQRELQRYRADGYTQLGMNNPEDSAVSLALEGRLRSG